MKNYWISKVRPSADGLHIALCLVHDYALVGHVESLGDGRSMEPVEIDRRMKRGDAFFVWRGLRPPASGDHLEKVLVDGELRGLYSHPRNLLRQLPHF